MKKKTKKVIIGKYGDKELIVEKDGEDYFWWYGKLCTITSTPYINEVDAEWLLRYNYDKKIYGEINNKVKEAFKEVR